MKIFLMVYFSIGIILGCLGALILTRKEVKQYFIKQFLVDEVCDDSMKVDEDFNYDEYIVYHEKSINEFLGFCIGFFEVLIMFGWHLLLLVFIAGLIYFKLKDKMQETKF